MLISWDLPPQTHKLANGQITILLSGSIVADLRQWERAKGLPGIEVLVIDAEKDKVRAFYVPSLGSVAHVYHRSTFILPLISAYPSV